MAITISATYAKKLGLPNYSSHSFLVTVQAEISSLRRIDTETARLYRLLQESVDKQVQEVGFLPDATKYGMIPSQPANGHGPSHTNDSNGSNGDSTSGTRPKSNPAPAESAKCSDKQAAFISRMGKRLKLSAADLDHLAIEVCQHPVAELDRKQASLLIDALFQLDGQPRRVARHSSGRTAGVSGAAN